MSRGSLRLLILLVALYSSFARCMDFKLRLGTQEVKCLLNTSFVAEQSLRESTRINSFSEEKAPKAAFTTIRDGVHRFCFINISQKENWVSIALKWGPAAYDSGSIASKADLEPIDLAVMNINIALKEYQANIKQMKSLSNTVQDETSTASSRIAALSIFNIISIIVINVLQTLYIKRFFRSRKLI
ncbi:emp24/gp25L/p24-like protein [Cryptosporidium canis]|uniref:Emp24/gp25L/p24-like protein n=1 Tax=Cryptosporidium canis TaxID=195482 RepID=A0ABQ8P4F8_9CRYT|nr:emp24/gp25L/p24-like protein [Cryptosporidium canis]